MFGHGDAYSIEGLNADQVAALIKMDPEYIGGEQKVKLFSCDTGKQPNGFARQLAENLGVTVEAPNRLLYPDVKINDFLIVDPVSWRKKGLPGSWVEYPPISYIKGKKVLIKMYIYEMCPHCLDELIERKQPPEDEESINYCPKCGKKMEWALGSEQKIDDTVTYKIILNDASDLTDYLNRKNRFIEELMKMGNIAFDEALEKCETGNSLIFEGNTKEIYLKMDLLDRFTPWIHYTVVPNIAFERYLAPFISICPTCGNDVIDKDGGLFCPVCNDWFLSPPL